MFKLLLIPDVQQKGNSDLVDVLTQASMKSIEREQPDGTIALEDAIDQEIMWWKTLEVSSPRFARFAFEIKELERQFNVAMSAMPAERAAQIGQDLLQMAQSYRRSIDAKGSESVIDKHNRKQTVFDKVGRNRIERIYATKGEKSRSLVDAISGKRKDDDIDNDS